MKFSIDISNCISVLQRGGLILYPTDTLWSIGCDATDASAVERIYKLKGRNREKNMIILVADESDIPNYCRQENLTMYDYIKGIDKPASVIYQNAINLAPNLINEDGSIGIRVVKDDFCRELIREYGKAIVAASSNLSGYPPPLCFSDIDNQIREGVDYIVSHRQEETTQGEPSTVLRFNGNGTFEILRP